MTFPLKNIIAWAVSVLRHNLNSNSACFKNDALKFIFLKSLSSDLVWGSRSKILK